jgi:hypothetical protein
MLSSIVVHDAGLGLKYEYPVIPLLLVCCAPVKPEMAISGPTMFTVTVTLLALSSRQMPLTESP